VARASIAFSLCLIFSAVSASASDFPARKAGLWEITIAGARPVKVRQCSDAASDEAMAQTSLGLPGDCAKHDVDKSGNTITMVSVCTSAGKTMISHMVITGSLDSEYTMTITSQAQKASSVAPPMTLYAKWLGPCAADQKPGDVIMPNGTKFNMLGPSKSARQ
jgi:hypothetical protein